MSQMKGTTNHLINEKSPYLLQHAYNPVDWYAWCEEAFDRAKSENKAIFLSIGYSTCHWCHVMEKESFEDEEVAEVLNKFFICIKVDKEERPDIDTIYMSVCTAVNGNGGWPLTIIMTPDQVPFFAATYLPKYSQGGRIGLLELLLAVAKMWKEEQQKLIQSGMSLLEVMNASIDSDEKIDSKEDSKKDTNKENNTKSSNPILEDAFKQYKSLFDEKYGGFREAPKFPSPHNLLFLLRYAKLIGNTEALHMVEVTLQHMYRGGIYDHICGGFSRYSTDRYWLAPHFEKMLYDNALLVFTYLETYQATGNPLYRHISENSLRYISKEMKNAEGGFYCAQDADSEGKEGKYYVFTQQETKHILGEDRAKRFNSIYDITLEGNFEGANILNLIGRTQLTMSEEEERFCNQCKKELYDYRIQRMQLHKDDKCLTSWNALMIVAYARAYKIIENKTYLSTAVGGLHFIETHLTDENNRLFVRYRDGESFGVGNIDDYAFLCWAYYEVYEVTLDITYLEMSLKRMNEMIIHFWDKDKSGFFFYADDAEKLIMRPKETYDGAIPSGNSVGLYILSKLARITGSVELKEYEQKQLEFISESVERYPSGYGFALLGYLEIFCPTKELICLLDSKEDEDKLKCIIASKYEPNLEVIIKTPLNERHLEQLIPFIKEYQRKEENKAFYYCENSTCREPVFTWEDLNKILGDKIN